jgi:hypothetical protein
MRHASAREKRSPSPPPLCEEALLTAQRKATQAKRVKLFHAMRDSAMGDVLPAFCECNYQQFYQFAIAMEQMLHTYARTRLLPHGQAQLSEGEASPAAEVRARARRQVTDAEVLACVTADEAYAWPWRDTLLPAQTPMVQTQGVWDEPRLAPGVPLHQLRVVGPYAGSELVEIGWEYAAGNGVVQRDCVYQSLVHLCGVLSKHPFFRLETPAAGRAALEAKRAQALTMLQARVERTFEAERAALMARLTAVQAEIEGLKKGPDDARAEHEARKELEQAVQMVRAYEEEMEAARVSATTRFADSHDEAQMAARPRWVELCGMQQAFWAERLSGARESVVAKRRQAEAARQRSETGAARLEGLEAEAWRLMLSPYHPSRTINHDHPTNTTHSTDPPMHDDLLKVVAQAMERVDEYLEAFQPFVPWLEGDVRARVEALQGWMQHEDVLLDAHLTITARTQAMLRHANPTAV